MTFSTFSFKRKLGFVSLITLSAVTCSSSVFGMDGPSKERSTIPRKKRPDQLQQERLASKYKTLEKLLDEAKSYRTAARENPSDAVANFQKAREFYKKAKEDVPSKTTMEAEIYERLIKMDYAGEGLEQPDYQSVVENSIKLFNIKPSTKPLNYMYFSASDCEDPDLRKKVAEYLKRVKKTDHLKCWYTAQLQLGDLEKKGRITGKKDFVKALNYFSSVASSNSGLLKLRAWFDIAKLYGDFSNPEKREDKAAEICIKLWNGDYGNLWDAVDSKNFFDFFDTLSSPLVEKHYTKLLSSIDLPSQEKSFYSTHLAKVYFLRGQYAKAIKSTAQGFHADKSMDALENIRRLRQSCQKKGAPQECHKLLVDFYKPLTTGKKVNREIKDFATSELECLEKTEWIVIQKDPDLQPEEPDQAPQSSQLAELSSPPSQDPPPQTPEKPALSEPNETQTQAPLPQEEKQEGMVTLQAYLNQKGSKQAIAPKRHYNKKAKQWKSILTLKQGGQQCVAEGFGKTPEEADNEAATNWLRFFELRNSNSTKSNGNKRKPTKPQASKVTTPPADEGDQLPAPAPLRFPVPVPVASVPAKNKSTSLIAASGKKKAERVPTRPNNPASPAASGNQQENRLVPRTILRRPQSLAIEEATNKSNLKKKGKEGTQPPKNTSKLFKPLQQVQNIIQCGRSFIRSDFLTPSSFLWVPLPQGLEPHPNQLYQPTKKGIKLVPLEDLTKARIYQHFMDREYREGVRTWVAQNSTILSKVEELDKENRELREKNSDLQEKIKQLQSEQALTQTPASTSPPQPLKRSSSASAFESEKALKGQLKETRKTRPRSVSADPRSPS
jgi:hypothetical protein